MKIDPSSPWVAYLQTSGEELAFDTPRCAFAAWRADPGTVARRSLSRLLFARAQRHRRASLRAGIDVLSPMGPDLVPVALANAERFARDHNGAPPKSAPDIVREGLP